MTPSLDLLARSPLFAGLDRQAMRVIARSLVTESWSAGQLIIGPTESVERFRIVVAGRVKITVANSNDGRELILWLLGPGDGFDVVSLLDGKPHAICAWALDEVLIVSAPISQWRDWLERFRPLRLAAHRYVAERLREITALAGDLALHDTPTRLANLLLRHFDTKHSDLLRGLPQRELASMIGSVRIVVSRVLAHMKRQAAATPGATDISAAHLERLMRRAEGKLARAKLPRAIKAAGR